MNKLKRSLAMLLVLCMLLSVVPFSVFADTTEPVETTEEAKVAQAQYDEPGNSEFGHSQGKGKDKDKHKEDALLETDPVETTVPETTVPETTVPETTVPETTVPETTVPETTVPETTVPETTVPETTVPETTVPETTEETTEATEETTEPTEEATEPVEELQPVVFSLRAGSFMKVFHLDCGRKYFTVDQIKELIDAISNVGFSHMELAIGNDGLRLLLDDMTVSANGTTYNSDTIKSGIKSGNEAYSHSGEWTEAEMDTILAYAKTKGIEIIPLVNNPGHMDSILAAMKACGIDGYYAGSSRTVDLENEKAVAFTQALVMKYAEYFASSGCNYFNIGADEYANDYHTDDTTGMGFGYLVEKNKYGNFVSYVNALVEDIMALGMTPIAFNDGIYYAENESFGTFNSNLMVAAWTGGYSGIKPASTTFLANKGHQLLNTNERWYYVLGRKQAVNSTYCYESALSNAKSESVTTVTDHQGSTPIGAMQCVWCDDPSVDYETYKSNVMTLINTLAENNTTYFTGPNVVEPAPEPEVPEDVGQTDPETNITVTAPGLTGVTVTKNEEITTVEGAVEGKFQAWDITPATADGNYIGEATVTVPVPAEWTNVRGGVLESEHGEEVLGIEGDLVTAEDGTKTFTFTVPHFSTVVAYELETAAEVNEVLVELTVGQTTTITDNTGNYESTYTGEGLDTTVATVAVKGNTVASISPVTELVKDDVVIIQVAEGVYLKADATTTTSVSEAAEWTVGKGDYSWNNPYFICDRNYLGQNSEGSFGLYSNDYPYYNFTLNDGYLYNTTLRRETTAKPVKVTGNTQASSTDITIAGVSVGETTATIGSTTYKIVVSKGAVSATITVGETKTYPDSSVNDPVVENAAVADAVLENGTLTITAKEVGTTTVTTDNVVYTITVVAFDPATVTPLTIEYWITNLHTRTIESTADNPVTTHSISAGTSGVATADGADLNAMIPDWTIKRDGDSGDDRQVEYWQVRLLDATQTNNSSSGHELQTECSGDDETLNGDQVTRVRYFDPGDGNGRRWQLLSGTNWLDVNREKVDVTDYNGDTAITVNRETSQIVAYYMEVVDIANANTNLTEMHVNAADWGKIGDGSESSSYADPNAYCSISIQIVYEDGLTFNPATTTAADLASKTIIFNYWSGGRGIGTFSFDGMDQFTIYQVTAETGEVTAQFLGSTDNDKAWNPVTVTDFEWDGNELVVWSGAPSQQVTIQNNAHNPDNSGNPEPTSTYPNDNLMWSENHEAILVRLYVKAVATEDSLRVHYRDRSANDLEFYKYAITVPEDEIFDEGFDMTGNGLELVNNSVTNFYTGDPQYVSADLKTMPEIKAYYRYCNYTLVDVERSEDGKDVYLYYTFTPVVSFVADFGLPIKITPADLNQEGYSTNTSDIKSVQVIGSKDTVAGSTAHAEYGELSVSGTTVTYTPTKILQNVDFFSVYVETTADNPNTTTNESAGINYRVYVFPATTVFYEESFLTYDSNWSVDARPTKTQKTEILGQSSRYGYDDAYKADTMSSNNTVAQSQANGATASFTFTGTGFQLYANSLSGENASGIVTVYSQGQKSKLYMIDTALTDGVSDATNQQTSKGVHYGLPIISETTLPYGTYTVQLKQTNGEKNIYIDGVRIINTINDTTQGENNIYYDDEEDHPEFHQLRDAVLNAIGVEKVTDSEYGTPAVMAGQVYNAANGATAIVLDESISYGSNNAQDLLDNGPKNELYLYPGQTLAFKVKTDRVAQLGLKSPTGSASFELKVNNVAQSLDSLSTTVDMFYKIAEKGDASGEGMTVTIAVSSGVLSVTDLKICDDPNAAFLPLTQNDIENVLHSIYDLGSGDSGETETPEVPTDPVEPELPEEPTEPEKPSKPEKPANKKETASLNIRLVDYRGKAIGSVTLKAKGEAGKTAEFSADEIRKAADKKLPKGYELVDSGEIENTSVGFGESETITIRADKVATLKITFVSLRGKKVGSATITRVQTANGYCRISASEIKNQAPSGRQAIWFLPATIPYGSTTALVIPVI